MIYKYSPIGVCSKELIIEIENGIIKNIEVIGGCNGNLQGISKLTQGMKIEDVIKKLKGINCKGRGTSCPDQISIALEKIYRREYDSFSNR